MDRSARFAIALLFGVALLCLVAGIALGSLVPVVASVVLGTLAAGVVVFLATRGSNRRPVRTTPARAVATSTVSPSSAITVIVPPSATPLAEAPADYVAACSDPAAARRPHAETDDATSQVPESPARPQGPSMPAGVEPEDVVECLLENARAAGHPVAAHLWLEDPASSTLRLVAAAGTARPDGTPEPVSGSILGRSLECGGALIQPLWRVRTADTEQLTWRFAVPLSAGEARGVAAVDLSGTESPDGAVLTSIAASLRGALSGALALHVARTETAAAHTLLDTASDLSRLLEPDAVLHTALARAMQLADAETGSIMLVDDDAGCMRIAVSVGLPPEVVDSTRVSEGEGIAGWVLASGQPLVVEDLNGRGPRSRRHGVRSAISVPLADQDGTLGVLNVGSRTFHARFSRSHLEALESLGRTTAIALRNARAVTTAQDLYFDTLKALALALETKDPYALGATDRVIDYAVALGDAMGLTSSEAQALRIAAMLHDIGMSAAGDVVAVSNRPLSTVEWGMLKMHPVIAGEILAQAPALKAAIPIVYHHHEAYDGSGYVVGLVAEQIPIGARILAVADSYVAMTSDRPYRKAMTPGQAAAELAARAGSQFDPEVVRAFIELVGEESPSQAPSE